MAERKCKLKDRDGKEFDCVPSKICGDCEYNTFKTGLTPEQYAEQKKAFEDAINCNDKKK